MRKALVIITLLGVVDLVGAAVNEKYSTASSHVFDESFATSITDIPEVATSALAASAADNAKQEKN